MTHIIIIVAMAKMMRKRRVIIKIIITNINNDDNSKLHYNLICPVQSDLNGIRIEQCHTPYVFFISRAFQY